MKNSGISRCQRFGHKGQLDKGPHAYGKKKIDNPIGIEKRVEQLLFLAHERTHVIGKQRMKTHVLKAKLIVTTQHLRLPVGPQCERRMPAPNRMLPEMRKRFGRLQKVTFKDGHVFS
jgi:hypothetical protein